MAFDVQEMFKEDLGQTVDDKGWISYRASRTLSVVSDSPSTTIAVRLSAAIPQINDPHPDSFIFRVVDVKVDRQSPIYFVVTVEYQTAPRPEGNEDQPPYELPVDIEWSGESSEEQIDQDADGNPIMVPGTRELIQGLTRPVDDLVGTFRKNVLLFNPVSILYYKNTVNSDTFLGFDPGIARIKDIKATNAIKDDVPYWVLTVTIAFRVPYQTTSAKAWYKRVLCQGYYELLSSNVVRATDDQKMPVTSPILLNATTGARLPSGDPAQWLEFKVFESIAFNGLGLI